MLQQQPGNLGVSAKSSHLEWDTGTWVKKAHIGVFKQ
jgi:hypothetical protein